MSELIASQWPLVSLGAVLRHRKEFIEIDDLAKYKRCRVQLHTRGIVLRDIVVGAAIKTKSQQICRADEFLVAEIDAKVGGFGIVPAELDGAIVSSHYFLFTIDSARLNRGFLGYFIRTSAFREQVGARGSTNYAAIRPLHVLGYEIPLPPLEEQRRIVAKIDQLAAKIDEARTLRRNASRDLSALDCAVVHEVFGHCTARGGLHRVLFAEVAAVARGKFGHRPRNEPRFYGGDIPFIQINDISEANRYIRVHSQTLNEDGLAISRMFPRGTVVIAITGATVGVTGILDFDCCFPDSIVGYIPRQGRITPEFLHYSLEHEKSKALAQATQTTQPNINLRILSGLDLVVPTMEEQRSIVEYLDGLQAKVGSLNALQEKTAAELDALLPAILDRAFKGEL